MTDTTTDLIQRYATEIERIIDAGTNADHTWVGLLSAFVQEYAGDHLDAANNLALARALSNSLDDRHMPIRTRIDTLAAMAANLIAHLEAQQTSQQSATAPPAAQQGDGGHGDGDKAVQAADGYTAEAVQAMSLALMQTMDRAIPSHREAYARSILAAAEPHIRAKIADEIEAMDLSDQYGPLTAHGARADAARIARQEQP